jgi:hypothetical protein
LKRRAIPQSRKPPYNKKAAHECAAWEGTN